MIQEIVRGCTNTTGDGQRLQTYYSRWSESTDLLQEMVRDNRHRYYRKKVRDCTHNTVGDQRLLTYYRKWLWTIDMLQKKVRD